VAPSTFACSRETSGQAAASPSEASRGQAPSQSEAAKSQAPSQSEAAKGQALQSEASKGQSPQSEASKGQSPSQSEASKGQSPQSEASKGQSPSQSEASKGQAPSASEASKGQAPPSESPPARPSGGGSTGRCVPWLDAAALVATSQSGRRNFFRTFEYDFATGALRVHDSDPFATGAEVRSPRVTDDTTTLSGAAKDRIERALFAVCPGPEALARRCAPGGCQRLVVTARSGSVTRVEDGPTVAAVMRELATLFPKLRTP
jgi:hypothetical protein